MPTSFVLVSCIIPVLDILLTFQFQALDPNIKLAYAEGKWDAEYYEMGVKALENVVRI
jgi:hypothetical protein